MPTSDELNFQARLHLASQLGTLRGFVSHAIYCLERGEVASALETLRQTVKLQEKEAA